MAAKPMTTKKRRAKASHSAAGIGADEGLLHSLDVVRERVRREALIHTLRENISPWSFAKLVTEHPKVTTSRSNASKITHRTINGLLTGEKSNANTVLMVQQFLEHSLNLPSEMFAVSKQTVDAAKTQMGFVRSAEKGKISRSALTHYVGVYTVKPAAFGPIRLTVIIDHHLALNVLLARAVLITQHKYECKTAVDRSMQYSIDAFLYGYAVPNDDELIIELLHASRPGSYRIVISDPDNALRRPTRIRKAPPVHHSYPEDQYLVQLEMFASQPDGIPAFLDLYPETFQSQYAMIKAVGAFFGSGGLPALLQFPIARDGLHPMFGARVEHNPYSDGISGEPPRYVFSKCDTHPDFEDMFCTGFNWMLIWRHRARSVYFEELEKRELRELKEMLKGC